VHLVQVDGLDAEAAQRRVERLLQVPPRQAEVVGPVAHREPALGGEHDAVPYVGGPRREPAADDLLGPAAAVDVGRVDEVAAGLDERVELRVRARLVGLRAERHRAQRQRRHRAPTATKGS
jgi:hypothetical protein